MRFADISRWLAWRKQMRSEVSRKIELIYEFVGANVDSSDSCSGSQHSSVPTN